MTLCVSCKNKFSNDRCDSNALPGLSMCGRHAKTKYPRIWAIVNNVDRHAIKISKIWKGYHVRNIIKLAGPGALKRSICNNQEELASMEPISSISVKDYFGFEENNKVYGFDVKTIIECMNRQVVPTNPYTRQDLTLETRKRLRQVIGYRSRNKLQTMYDKDAQLTVDQMIRLRWLQISQICEENGFFNIPYQLFMELNKAQLFVFLNMISNDMKTWAAEHKGKTKRLIYVSWIRNIINRFSRTEDTPEYSFFTSTVLLSILYDSVDPYSICFIIMSALYRL
jgi:hypothetical protein